MSASEIELKIHKKEGITYVPKRLREAYGLNPKILPNEDAAIMYRPDATPEEVIRSAKVLIQHLELRTKKEVMK